MTNDYTPPIDTVIIPVGGFGTRMGESTRAVPKALLSVGDKPLLLHAIDEARAAGANRIIIPCRPEDEQLFKRQFEDSEARLQSIQTNGRLHLIGKDEPQKNIVEVVSIYNREGPASTIANLVKERDIGAFGVILPDDLMVVAPPALKQMMNSFEKNPMTTIGARNARLDIEHASNATFVKTEANENGMCTATIVQIKPVEQSPVSQNATCGRYIFGADFAQAVADCDTTGLKEVSMSAIVRHYAENSGVSVTPLNDAQYFDCGDKAGYWRAQAAFMDPDILQEIFSGQNPSTAASQKDFDTEHSITARTQEI